MMVLAEVPADLFVDVEPSTVTSATGEVLERLVDVPVGPWTPVLLCEVDPAKLTAFELPAYLTAWSRVQAWAAGQLAGAVVELSSRPDVAGAEKEVAVALREPVGAAQQRIWRNRRLRRMLPQTWRLFRAGDLSERHPGAMVDAMGGVDDPALAVEVEYRALRVGRSSTDKNTDR